MSDELRERVIEIIRSEGDPTNTEERRIADAVIAEVRKVQDDTMPEGELRIVRKP